MGVLFGSIELGIIGALEEIGQAGLTGLLFGCWGLGSIVVGLIAMRHRRSASVERLILGLLAAMVLNLPLILAAPPGWLGLALVFAGSPNAIIIGQVYSLIPRFAAAGRVTEAFAVEVAGMISGVGVGTLLAGLAASAIGPHAPFGVAVIAVTLALVLVASRRRLLAVS